MSARYMLAESTLVEPLVNDWAAWWCLLAPVPAAFHAAQYQLPTLESFLKHPAIHQRAARDPLMAGSAFVNLPPERVPEVQALVDRSRLVQRDALALVEAWNSFEARLLAEAQGQPMETFYSQLPPPLRGLVELLYDYQGRPSIRLLEPLSYHGPLYQEGLQAVRFSTVGADEERKFWLNTPRLSSPEETGWHLPLNSPRLAQLFALDVEPQPLEVIEQLLGDTTGADWRKFFREADPTPLPRWEGPGTRLRFFGHASMLVETPGSAVLFDPLVPVRPARGGAPRFSYRDLPERIDLAVITHSHMDHFVVESLLRLRGRIKTLVVPRSHASTVGDASLKLVAERLGFTDVRALDSLESVRYPGGELTALPFLGEHGDYPYAKSTWVLQAGAQRFLFGADSACHDVELYHRARRVVGPVEHILLNTEVDGAPAAYTVEGLLPKTRNRKLERTRKCRGSNAQEGLALFQAMGGQHLYNYAMGLEPWVSHLLGASSPAETSRVQESEVLLASARAAGARSAERVEGRWERVLE